tara:strand:+ start:861 stop:971 length:111 start_codon:yes stop_codon:yes gene_type:complete
MARMRKIFVITDGSWLVSQVCEKRFWSYGIANKNGE